MPVANLRGKSGDQAPQKQAAEEPVEGMIVDPGGEGGPQWGGAHAREMHLVAGGGLTIGEVYAVAFGSGDTGGKQNMKNTH